MSNPTANALTAQRAEQRSLAEAIKHPSFQQQIQASLPPSVSLEKFTAVTIAALNHNPDLMQADRQSFYNAVVKSAQEGLLPDGQEAILNIYNTKVGERWIQKVQFQRMVQGIIKQFREAGIDAYACCVYEGEMFELLHDEHGQHLTHRPKPFGPKGEFLGSYAVAKMPGGASVIVTMDLESLQKARAASKSGDGANSPWNKWFDRMAEKSSLHRLRKRVSVVDPKAAEKLRSIDEEFENDDDDKKVDPPPPAQQPIPTSETPRPKALQSVLENAADSPPPGESEDPGPQAGDII